MNLRILVGFILVLASCGDGTYQRHFETTNPVFDKYIKDFEREGQAILEDENFRVGDIPINFDSFGKTGAQPKNKYIAGTCIGDEKKKEILIDSDYWSKSSIFTDKEGNNEVREILIFHELGHCRLNLDHPAEDTVVYNERLSIMHPTLIQTERDYYSLLRIHFFTQLFTKDFSKLKELKDEKIKIVAEEETQVSGLRTAAITGPAFRTARQSANEITVSCGTEEH